jgi:hypothetical protein
MKSWVKPFLEKRGMNILGINENQISNELLKLLKYEFGIEPELPMNLTRDQFITEQFKSCFSSVLADLPESIFEKLITKENLFFIFIPVPGAEVKLFELDRTLNAGELLQVVSFQYSDDYNIDEMRGIIVHELAHVYLEHRHGSTKKTENEADETAIQWGFKEEIEAKKAWIERVHEKIGD